MKAVLRLLTAGVLACGLGACAMAPKEPPIIASKQSPVALRAMQIRAFDTTDKRKTVQAVIAALQDLGYTIVKVDYATGTLTAAKFERLRMTIAVYPHGQNQFSVRANALVVMPGAMTQVDDPEFYQKYFFEPLAQSMFLAAVAVEDDPAAPSPPVLKETEITGDGGATKPTATKPQGSGT
jgi:hypothetical protein